MEVVRQERSRVNIDILGILEIKWTGMDKLNLDDHYVSYCGQQSLTRNGIDLIVNKRVQNAVLGCNLKNDRMTLVHYQGKPFNITVIQIYASTTNTKDADVEWFLQEWPTRPSRTNSKKICPFQHRGLDCKSRKSRDTWSNRQVWSYSAQWSKAKANRVLPKEHTGHSKHPLPTTQEMTLHMDIIRWSVSKSDWLYSLQLKMEKIYIDSKDKTRCYLPHRSWALYCKIQA